MPPSQSSPETALVTGASSGIGAAIAEGLARRHHDVVLVARRAAKLDAMAARLSKEHGVRAVAVTADLEDRDAPLAIAAAVAAEGLTVTTLVNNAGFGWAGHFEESDEASQLGMIDVNVRALTALTHRFLPAMVAARHGRVLNVASTAAFQPGPFLAVYFASKAYVLSFSEALSNELSGTGVTVTCLCPGPTRTEFETRANIAGTKLFAAGGVMAADEVAELGIVAMLAGERRAIPSMRNTVLAHAARVAPRAFTLWVTRLLLAPKGVV
jgi:short-subunit dehydrogenase